MSFAAAAEADSGDEWEEPLEAAAPTLCLLCTAEAEGPEKALEHMRDCHSFDLRAAAADMGVYVRVCVCVCVCVCMCVCVCV